MVLSRAEKVQRHIMEEISAQGLAAGQRLPSVRQLAEDCQVTTPTVREALRALEAAGVVELRHGSGTYVHPHAFRFVRANALMVPTSTQCRELVEARVVIEPPIAAEAARHRSEDDLRALEECAECAIDAQLPDDHVSFHVLVAQATGNGVLVDVVEGLLSIRKQDHAASRAFITDRKQDRAQHRRIVEAIRCSDPIMAERLMREHLQWLANCSDR